MMRTKLNGIFLSLILFLGFSYQQTIFLLPYNGSSITPCSSGLIQSVDDAIFYSQINISGKQDSLENVNFEIKKKDSTYNILCYIHLSDCTGYKLSYCYCLKTDQSHVFNVVINITAYANYSQASLRGKMTFTDTVQYSEEQMLPKIYDTSLVHGVLYVNDKVVDVRRCKISLTTPEIILVFFVPEHLQVPARLQLEDSNTSTVLKNGTGFLSYSRNVSGELFLTLVYEVCSVQDKRHNFVCLFESDTSKDNILSGCIKDERLNLIITAVYLLTLAMPIGIFCLYYWLLKHCYCINKKDKRGFVMGKALDTSTSVPGNEVPVVHQAEPLL